MSSISPFWIYLLQIFLIVHVLKTDRSRYWILMLLFVPMIGGIAYLVVEILPELTGGIRGQRARRNLGQMINPGGRLKDLEAAWERTPNADNARHYADALLEAGRLDEAESILQQARSGLFRNEPNLMLLEARILFEKGAATQCVEVLNALQAENPEFRSATGHLLLARALEAAGETENSLEEYRAVASYYPGVEARYRLARALSKAGREDEAQQQLKQIIEDARLAPAHFRKAQAAWLRQAKAALK